MAYNIDEHRHRLAVWAAARAAQRALRGFDVKAAGAAIESCELREISSDWRHLPAPDDFDREHHRWCRIAMPALDGRYGRAAKLVNMYLKLRVVCGPASEIPDAQPKIGAIHPPIDRQLLNGLAQACAGQDSDLRRELIGLRDRGWTNFDDQAYQAAIVAVRTWQARYGDGASGLWRVEQHWRLL